MIPRVAGVVLNVQYTTGIGVSLMWLGIGICWLVARALVVCGYGSFRLAHGPQADNDNEGTIKVGWEGRG